MALILPPLMAGVGYCIGMPLGTSSEALAFVLSFILVVFFWIVYSNVATMPDKASVALFPVFLVFCYYMCVWIAVFGLSGYRFDSGLFDVYCLLTLPYLLMNFNFAFVGDYSYFPILNAGITAVVALATIIMRAINKKRLHFDKRAILLIGVFACLCGVAGFQHYDRGTKFLDRDAWIERVEDEVDYRSYLPFKGEDIGYSFRYFATEMYRNDDIRLLAIDGVKPRSISIRNGRYPFSIDVYAVTAGPPDGNAEMLIQWILSGQGQEFIKKCGYVKLPAPSALPPPSTQPEESPVEEERPDLAEWERLINDWPMDFGFSDSTGTRFIFQPGMPYEELIESGFDPEMYSLLIGGHCEIASVVFDGWQAGSADDSAPYFDRQQGFVYKATNNGLSTKTTYMLSSPGPLADALVPLSQPPGDPYSIKPTGAENVERIEACKDRGVDFSTVLAQTEDGGQICLVVYEPIGDEALLSIAYIDETNYCFGMTRGSISKKRMWACGGSTRSAPGIST